jgi:hypothetical protein
MTMPSTVKRKNDDDRYVVEPIHTLIGGGYAWRNSRGGGYEQFVR